MPTTREGTLPINIPSVQGIFDGCRGGARGVDQFLPEQEQVALAKKHANPGMVDTLLEESFGAKEFCRAGK
jgi:hypothetical protein